MENIKGKISSFQTLGTLDGPGVRFVVFLQGCPLRCACCHNPETWDVSGGKEFAAYEIAERAERYKEYFGEAGGITLSGGEPLLQSEFCTEIFKLCKSKGINTCLDTSGCVLNDSVKELLKYTDYCMLDIKYTDDSSYKKYVGCSLKAPLDFLEYLGSQNIKTRIRQVIIPELNDTEDNIKALNSLINGYKNIDTVELLPFKNLCTTKYEKMNLKFPLEGVSPTSKAKIDELNKILNF